MVKTNRIESLDLLKGLVMVIMALDHTRDYFHYDSFFIDPTDPEKTNTILYFTRWITHYCAPAFSLLAGISAFLVGQRKSKKELSLFLLSRGFWLIFIELTVVNFAWKFDIYFSTFYLLVIWSLGVSMIFLAAIIHLKLNQILIVSLIIIFGHNLLDDIAVEDNFLFAVMHQMKGFEFFGGTQVRVIYPIIPWIGAMSLGYYFGSFYRKTVDPQKRQLTFTVIGLVTILLFIIIRLFNEYGNPKHWEQYDTMVQSIFSFLDPSKYPPSLSYLLMTLGPTLLFLGNSEHLKGKVVKYFQVFGKVPFFFYIIHIYLIHFFAAIFAEITNFGWESMILQVFISSTEQLKGYGVNLFQTYLIWIGIIIMVYPLCKRFSIYKTNHKEKWWLSYF